MSNKFETFLSDIGSKLKEFFTKAAPVVAEIDQAGTAAEPFINIAFPGAAAVYDTVVTAVGQAENAAIAAGANNGTGAQKLALVLASPTVQQAFKTIESVAGVSASSTAQQTSYINAVVATLNAFSKQQTESSPAAE